MKNTKVIIEVRGGNIVSVMSNNKSLKYVIVDHDNVDNGESATGEILEPDYISEPLCNAFGKEDAPTIEIHEDLKRLKF